MTGEAPDMLVVCNAIVSHELGESDELPLL